MAKKNKKNIPNYVESSMSSHDFFDKFLGELLGLQRPNSNSKPDSVFLSMDKTTVHENLRKNDK